MSAGAGRAPGDGPAAVRSRTVIAVHVLSFILLTALVFNINEPALFLRFDGLLHLTEIGREAAWGGPLHVLNMDVTKANGELSYPNLYRMNPALVVARWVGDGRLVVWLAFTLLATMFFLSVLFLLSSIGFDTPIALGAAWLACLLTLPYVVPVLTYIRLWGSPPFLAVLASMLVSLGLFFRLGRGRLAISAVQAVAIFALQLYAAMLAPSVFVMGSPAIGFFAAVALTTAASRRELAHKIVGALTVALALIQPLGFVVELHALSKVTFFRRELDAAPMSFRDISFFLHPHEEAGLVGAAVLVVAILGAATTTVSADGRRRRVALGYLAFMLALGATAAVVASTAGEWWGPPLGYVDMAALPFHGLFAATFLRHALQATGRYLAPAATQPTAHAAPIPAPLIAALGFAAVPWICLPVSLATAGTSTFYRHHVWPWPPRETPLVSDLKHAIGLSPGALFRGRVVNLAGTDGPYPGSHPPFNNQHVYDYGFIYHVGNDHRNLGLWSYSIPTLTTTSNFTSPFFHLVVTRFLNEPDSRSVRGHVPATRFNRRILESLGTRFVIHDASIPAGAVLRRTYQMAGRTLWLYELTDPNVGTYSPTRVHVTATARAALTLMANEAMDLRQEAVAHVPVPTRLEAAESEGLRVLPDAVRIRATSRGTSLLVLPVEYSHCLVTDLATPHPETLKVVRVNVNQTGIVFTRRVAGDIRLRFGMFANRGCRWRDLAEARQLRLHDTEGWWPG